MVMHRLLPVLFACLIVNTVQAATFSAHIDRKSMTQDETLILELTLTDSDTRLRAEGEQPNVDLTLLSRDFELGTPRERHRFNIERNRGRATSTLHVELFPRHTGDLKIPVFRIDDLSTQAITVHVVKADPERTRELFVRTGVVKDHLWVHETTLLYLDLYRRIDIESAQLGGLPDTEPKDVDFERVGSRDRTETVDGLEYQVNRTAWALAPRLAGSIKVQMPDVWVVTLTGDRRRLPFSDVEIAAKALPASVPEGVLIGRPELSLDLRETAIAAGTPAPLTLTIRASGLPQQMPATPPELNIPEGIRLYNGTPKLEGPVFANNDRIATTIEYPLQLLPNWGGRFQLPAIDLPYFDPVKGTLAVVSVRGPVLNVTPGPSLPDTTVEHRSPSGDTITPVNTGRVWIWQLVSLAFGLLWLGTLLLVLRRRARPDQAGQPLHEKTSSTHNGTAIDRLLVAMGTRTLEAGLIRWERRYGADSTRRELVRTVQRARYSGRNPDDEQTLQQAVNRILQGLPKDRSDEEKGCRDPWHPESFTPSGQLRDR